MSDDNLNVISASEGVAINNPNFFLTISNFEVSDGLDIVENINVLLDDTSKKVDFENLCEISEKFNTDNNIEGSYICQNSKSIDYFRNSYKDFDLFTFNSNDVIIEEFTKNLKVANSPLGFGDAKIDISHIIFIDKILSPKMLLKLYKIAINIKAKFFESLKLPLHISNILNNNDFLVISSKISPDTFNEENIHNESVDINNNYYEDDDINLDEFKILMEDAIIISCEDTIEKLNLNFGILDYFVSEGILIGDLVEAGFELCEGVEVTDELKEKLEQEILKSLSDINVIALLMAAIRTEEDFSNNRLREVDVSDDPAYLYSDEILGMAIANQIAGSKAIFNFARYDKAKPGIIYGLGPMMDDIFAGLIAGCMSKIFEE
ncbi:phosphatidylglycerophosphatase A [Methanobrevibacter sp. DSM 116169]|uniref:phosphatidylglycerophosphatase A n=1 Tax=Methanobrevibacter sp. DSM 116169 TaxID=3242727 RepID=UPI0038FCF1A8